MSCSAPAPSGWPSPRRWPGAASRCASSTAPAFASRWRAFSLRHGSDLGLRLRLVCRVEPGASIARCERLQDSLDVLPRRGAGDESVLGHALLRLERRAVAPAVDVYRHAQRAASTATLPPSFAQRSASWSASE